MGTDCKGLNVSQCVPGSRANRGQSEVGKPGSNGRRGQHASGSRDMLQRDRQQAAPARTHWACGTARQQEWVCSGSWGRPNSEKRLPEKCRAALGGDALRAEQHEAPSAEKSLPS
eukprot:2602980-Rhodomonas_salina.2